MKQAIQRFIRDDKGHVKVVLIDAQTLQPVVNPAEYEIINQTNTPYWEPVQDVATPDVPSKVQPPAPELNQMVQAHGGDPTAPGIAGMISAAGPKNKGSNAEQLAQVMSGKSPARVPELSGKERYTKPTDGVPYSGPGSTISPGDFSGTPNLVGKNPTLAPGSGPAAPRSDALTAAQPSISGSVGVPPQDRAPTASMADMSVGTERRGMAALTDRLGTHRPNMPSAEISDKVRQAAAQVFGPDAKVVATSGTEGNLPQYGSNRHKTAKAMDFHVEVNGKPVTDQSKLKDFSEVASTLGVKGTGFGPEYMGADTMHMDTVDPSTYSGVQDRAWGSLGNAWQGQLESAEYTGNTKAYRDQPHGIPQARPTVAGGIIGQAKSGIVGDPSKVSPAQMAGMGLMTHPRTPDQISRMAAAFAGELSPQQLDALAAGDETAKKELAGMISTAENRASKAKSFDAVFDPGQYNSLLDSKQSVTKGNYSKYGSTLRDAIGSFYTGELKPESYDPTSYYNPSISDPTWGSKNKGRFGLMGAMDVGEHRFGSVADRSYKTTDLSGQADRPSEGSRFGLGGLGRGLDSPSESNGSRFGGQGLGSSTNNAGREGSTSGPGLGLGGRSTTSPSKSDKDKDRSGNSTSGSRSVGPSGGGYGGWGGPR